MNQVLLEHIFTGKSLWSHTWLGQQVLSYTHTVIQETVPSPRLPWALQCTAPHTLLPHPSAPFQMLIPNVKPALSPAVQGSMAGNFPGM